MMNLLCGDLMDLREGGEGPYNLVLQHTCNENLWRTQTSLVVGARRVPLNSLESRPCGSVAWTGGGFTAGSTGLSQRLIGSWGWGLRGWQNQLSTSSGVPATSPVWLTGMCEWKRMSLDGWNRWNSYNGRLFTELHLWFRLTWWGFRKNEGSVRNH